MRVSQQRMHLAVAGAAIGLIVFGAPADDVWWIDPDGGLFSDPLNWSTGNVPGPGDYLYFDLASLYEVQLTGDVTVDKVSVLNDRLTLDLGGFTFALDFPGLQLVVGGDPPTGLAGRLTVFNGTFQTRRVDIAPDPDSVGAVEFAGPDASWDLSEYLFIGNEGAGSLDVINGASLVVGDDIWIGREVGATGALAVVGPGSTVTEDVMGILMQIGSYGSGSLFITNGGRVEMQYGYVHIARYAGSCGSVSVSGQGSFWKTELDHIGMRGPGYLEVTDGGTVMSTAVDSWVAWEDTGSGWITVRGPGSHFDVYGDLRVRGEGEILVEDGGVISGGFRLYPRVETRAALIATGEGSRVEGNDLRVGGPGQGEISIIAGASADVSSIEVSSEGVAEIVGPASAWVVSGVSAVGDTGPASLGISNGATVDSHSGSLRNEAEILVTGAQSAWDMTGDLSIEGTSGSPILIVDDGGSCESLRVFLADEPGAAGTIRIDGPESRLDVLSDFTMGASGAGSLSVLGGASVTVALVGGAYTQAPSGSLVVELAPSFDVAIQVYGTANLAGSLSVTLADGFDPPAGETFDVIAAWSIPDQFDEVTLSPTPSGRELELSYLPDRVRIVVLPLEIPGDLDGDETVGILDFLLLLGSWGPCPEPCPPSCSGDLDGDCQVGIIDLLTLLGNWG
jgi:T5SS/PEP-CTERM-associated repeat protein